MFLNETFVKKHKRKVGMLLTERIVLNDRRKIFFVLNASFET